MSEGEVGDIKARHLFRYWTSGPGAIKIGWGVPHDFDRCVTLLTKYFPKDPKGLCANLHHRALGVWPGQEDGGRHGHHLSAFGEEEVLVASAPVPVDTTMPMKWMAPLFAYDKPTTDVRGKRTFPRGMDFSHRELPVPLEWSEAGGHGNASAVGRIRGVDLDGDYPVAWGDLFTEDTHPQVKTMVAEARAGVLGLSMIPGGPVDASLEALLDADGNETGSYNTVFSKYMMGGATAVRTPAFAGQRMLIWNDSEDSAMDEFAEFDPDAISDGDADAYELIASGEYNFQVLPGGWENMSVADRYAKWSSDHAVQRIFTWAGGQPAKLAQVFLWRNPQGDPRATTSYRLPIADIIDGDPVILYSAVYHAAALLQGGHGGLPMVNDTERAQLKQIVTRIYAKISDALNVKLLAPWNRAPTRTTRPHMEAEGMDETYDLAVNGGGWSNMPMAAPDTAWDGGAAKKALGERAGINGDNPSWQKYGEGFLWHAESPQSTGDFKLPIATVVDGKLTIIPRAVNAVASVLAGGRGGVDIPDADKSRIASIVAGLQKRFKDGDNSMTAAGAPLAPPTAWFEDPKLPGKTKITVDDAGRVFGHLADWTTCHLSYQNKCIMAPHSHNDYADFHVGTVVTEEGDVLDAGNLTANTGHAALSLGASKARSHYDDTGAQVAVVRAGEDEFGIWVAGALVPEVDIPATAALMRRSPLSGDWRAVDGHLSLVAALHVNRPGFQIKPMFSMDEDGEILSLQAAGVLHENVENTVYMEGVGGGTIVHTPQVSTPAEEIDPQVMRAIRLDAIRNAPARADRVKRLLGGK